ncbi:MAG: hypothetical protein U1E45_08830 [Geminicoccaceae bacterium]
MSASASSISEAVPPLERLVAVEMLRPVSQDAHALAEAARLRHGPAVAAVLFYGSCLREDPSGSDRMLDLYLLVDSYARVEPRPLLARLARLLPPNVHYVETPLDGRTVRAKYAIVETDQLTRLAADGADESYFWGRFAQPVRLVWSRDEAARVAAETIVATSVRTFLGEALPLLPPGAGSDEVWAHALSLSYGSELRSERPGKAQAIVAAEPERYAAMLDAYRAEGHPALSAAVTAARWRRRRRRGKLRSVLRLMKAAFTFDGGADYLAWKIGRHSGVRIEVTDWQRRHPILAAPFLYFRLYRAGAFR